MSNANNMSALDIARRLVELGQAQEAVKAYTIALGNAQGQDPETELECALNILQLGGNYLVAYDALRDLYGRGKFTEDCLSVMTEAFYAPNEKLLKSRYEKNCRLLQKYPYIFRKDFLSFEELPLRFYPYDDNRYLPFDGQFGELIEPNEPVVSRNFFRDLSKPIFASDVFSMYELEYLYDNVRKSEWVGYENHIYLHYSDWAVFCSWLQILNLREILKDEKIVFLMEDEAEQYPIDFKERFGKDYSKYPLKPVAVQEYNRLIWHTQLATHNGGDFFNEIFDAHPNLVLIHSAMLTTVEDFMAEMRRLLKEEKNSSYTEKDLLVATFLHAATTKPSDPAARIVPAIFFQPHFPNIRYTVAAGPQNGTAVFDCPQYQDIISFPAFKLFKYIKTFTPMRRPTTSTAASVRFMTRFVAEDKLAPDLIADRILNQSYLVDRDERLFRDSVIVRFEDGKLNPKATFTALAAFLDLPYTESMTYCSFAGRKNVATFDGNAVGFDASTVYRTYDEFLGEPERRFLEFILRDAYRIYGYDFKYYDGKVLTPDEAASLADQFPIFDNFYLDSAEKHLRYLGTENSKTPEEIASDLETHKNLLYTRRRAIARLLCFNLRYVNKQGRPLRFTPLLQLDPELLEAPLYR